MLILDQIARPERRHLFEVRVADLPQPINVQRVLLPRNISALGPLEDEAQMYSGLPSA